MIWHWRGIEAAVLSDVVGDSIQAPALDLGCGDGVFLAEWLRSGGAADVGVDLSARSVARAASSDTYRSVLVADATRLPLASDHFATVFSNSTVEHIPSLGDLLSEVARVLRPGGSFVLTVPNQNLTQFLISSSPFTMVGAQGLARWWADRRNGKLAHFHLLSEGRWRSLLSDAGLEDVTIRPYLSVRSVALWELLRDVNLGVGRYRVYAALKHIGTVLDRVGLNIGRRTMRAFATLLLPHIARWEVGLTDGACWIIVARKPSGAIAS